MATTYENRTKDELLELAQERDVKGRSKMTKDELVAALRGETTEEAPRAAESAPEAPKASAGSQERHKAALVAELQDYPTPECEAELRAELEGLSDVPVLSYDELQRL